MAVVATFPKVSHDWLKHELDACLFREGGIIASGAGEFGTGLVVGKITASGKLVAYNPAGADGSQNAYGIVINRADATSADVETAVLIGNAQIVPSLIVWGAAVTTQAHKDTALAALAAKGIVSHQR